MRQRNDNQWITDRRPIFSDADKCGKVMAMQDSRNAKSVFFSEVAPGQAWTNLPEQDPKTQDPAKWGPVKLDAVAAFPLRANLSPESYELIELTVRHESKSCDPDARKYHYTYRKDGMWYEAVFAEVAE